MAKKEDKVVKDEKKKIIPPKKEKKVKKVVKEKTIQVKDIQEDVKLEKKKRFWDEFKAFIILAVIILVIIIGGWYWYTYVYKDLGNKPSLKEEKVVDKYKSYKYIVADTHKLDVLNDEYLIEYDDNYIYKVMDMNTNILFEGEAEYSYYIEDFNNNFYLIINDIENNQNYLSIYKLEDKEFKLDKELSETAVYYVPIIYEDNDDLITLGFTGTKYSYDDENNEQNTTYLYTLDGEEYELDNYQILGDEKITKPFEAIITYNKDNIIVGTSKTYSDLLYGLLELKSGNTIIRPQYEGLYTDGNNYIAVKDGKTGIITNKLKKLVNFEYDFIDRYDSYYVVAKNKKMAIMDNNFKLVTDFVFDYQEKTDGKTFSYTDWNTINSYKVNDKYVLVTNNLELENNIKYAKSLTYIIDKNGKYESVTANKFEVNKDNGLIYAYDNIDRIVTIYNSSLEEMYKIDLSNYDFSLVPKIELINGNTIEIELDSSIYFDYENGKEINEIKDFSLLINGITINYDKKDKKMIYSSSDKEIVFIDVDVFEDSNNYFVELDENAFYYATDTEYLYIEEI